MSGGDIFYLKGANFGNPNLPRVQPFAINNIMPSGLLAAWRPATNMNSLLDLSGNGAIATLKGMPVFDSLGVVCDANNGIYTNVQETLDITVLTVARAVPGADGVWGSGSNYNAWASGGFALDGSSYHGGTRALGANFTIQPVTGGVELRALTSFGLYNKTSDSYTQSNFQTPLTRAASFADLSGDASPWVFSALSISGEKVAGFVPALSWKTNRDYSANETQSIRLRLMADIETGEPSRINIGSVHPQFTNWALGFGKAHIAEVLVYNRGLSEDEIMIQYSLSQEWMSGNRGITI